MTEELMKALTKAMSVELADRLNRLIVQFQKERHNDETCSAYLNAISRTFEGALVGVVLWCNEHRGGEFTAEEICATAVWSFRNSMRAACGLEQPNGGFIVTKPLVEKFVHLERKFLETQELAGH